MGSSASVVENDPKYTPEQKAEIRKLYDEKFNALLDTEEGKQMNEQQKVATGQQILRQIQEQFDNSNAPKRKSFGIIRLQAEGSKPSTPAQNRLVVTKLTVDGKGGVASKDLGSVKPYQEQIKSTEEVEHHSQAALNNFLNRLQFSSGDSFSDDTSTFRKRRLSTAQRIDEKKDIPVAVVPVLARSYSTSERRKSVVIPAGEIGDDVIESLPENTQLPFDPTCLGQFSCHGIEPANNPSGVHDKINQDRGCYVYPFNNSDDEILFMALDGHGQEGDKVSEFAMQQIAVILEAHPQLQSDPIAALIDTFETTNRALTSTKIQYYSSGSTCVTVYMRPEANGPRLYVANVGDSRAVIGTLASNGSLVAVGLTNDHKPDAPGERTRIEGKGGFVTEPPEPGLSGRVWLNRECTMIGLAMSRSIGDYAVKNIGVIASPEVLTHDLIEADQFLIMGSDGVWEFISNQEAVDIVKSNLHLGSNGACEALITEAARRWNREEGDYRDDITALVIKMPLVLA